MIGFPFWTGCLGWLGTILFWAIVAVAFYQVVKWLNDKL